VDGTFVVNASTGEVTINNTAGVDFESGGEAGGKEMLVRVSDGTFSSIIKLFIRITDQNDPVSIEPAQFTIEENLPMFSLVGQPMISSDPDEEQTTLFSIDESTNPNGAFAINKCSGQLRVQNEAMINYERFPVHRIRVIATDDGEPPTNDSAIIEITLLDVNDAPTLNGSVSFEAPENILAERLVARFPAFDEDNDTLSFRIVAGDPSNFFDILTSPVHLGGLAFDPDTGHAAYYLATSDRLISSGDGTGVGLSANESAGRLVLNYEDTLRPSLRFNLRVQVEDDSGTPEYELRSDSEFFTIHVGDRNDPPRALNQQRAVPENSLSGVTAGVGLQTSDEDEMQIATIATRRTDSRRYSVVWPTVRAIYLSVAQAVGIQASAPYTPALDHSILPFNVTESGNVYVQLVAGFSDSSGSGATAFGGGLDREHTDTWIVPVRAVDSGGPNSLYAERSVDFNVTVSVTDV